MSRKRYREAKADWLRRNRMELGMSQAELAAAVDVSEASVSRWETGQGMSDYSSDRIKACFKARLAERAAAGARS